MLSPQLASYSASVGGVHASITSLSLHSGVAVVYNKSNIFVLLKKGRVLVSFFFSGQILVIWFFPSPSRNRYFFLWSAKKRVNKKFSALRAKRSVHFASKHDDVGW